MLTIVDFNANFTHVHDIIMIRVHSLLFELCQYLPNVRYIHYIIKLVQN
jgi:hypothetical protein